MADEEYVPGTDPEVDEEIRKDLETIDALCDQLETAAHEMRAMARQEIALDVNPTFADQGVKDPAKGSPAMDRALDAIMGLRGAYPLK